MTKWDPWPLAAAEAAVAMAESAAEQSSCEQTDTTSRAILGSVSGDEFLATGTVSTGQALLSQLHIEHVTHEHSRSSCFHCEHMLHAPELSAWDCNTG